MDFWATSWQNLQQTFGVKFLLSPVYLGATVLIVWAVWLYRGKPTGFLRFMLPRELYVHPSTLVDIKVGLFNTLFTATGAISALLVTPYVTIAVLQQLGGELADAGGVWHGVLAAALLFLTQDFCRYWNHYLHHETKVLWPFHAVHHSAEVMTPLTFLRAHPMYSALQALMISALVGIVQALILWALVGQIEPWAIYAGTIAFNTYVFFGAHLRHSHIWVSYGRVMEHILISPAQHQIHHSSDPIHHDKNYGEVFAIWDWMFGTLYVPDGYETLDYGLADGEGNKIPQKHPTLKDALIGPFEEVWEEITKGTSLAKAEERS
ncbi:sterol desaturase family protein [Yoonia sp. R2331]|uniref:sterol desaturase family protein n=1 Tax=Yoonia sp. R2331 TaxID=3237238 RepID=UPI0034E3CC7D